MELANGKYLQFLDSDDLLEPQAIKHKVDFLEGCSKPTFCLGKTFNFYFNVDPHSNPIVPRVQWKYPGLSEIRRALYYFNIAPPHSYLIKAKDVKDFCLRFDTSLKACEDYDFWFKLALKVGHPTVVPESIAYYRRHAASMSKNRLRQVQHDTILCQRIYQTICNGELINGTSKDEALVLLLVSSFTTFRRLYFLNADMALNFYTSFVKAKLIKCILSRDLDRRILETLPHYLAVLRYLLIKITTKDQSIPLEDVTALKQNLQINSIIGPNSFLDKYFVLREYASPSAISGIFSYLSARIWPNSHRG